MPHKYQREIEEILRNMERTEPESDLGERIRPFARPRPPRPRVSFVPQLDLPTGLIVLGILIALVGSGLAYYQVGATLISGIIALAGFTLFLVGVSLGWWARFRGVTGANVSPRSLRRPPRSENVVRLRPPRSTPFSRMLSNIRMRQMRKRFRNVSDH